MKPNYNGSMGEYQTFHIARIDFELNDLQHLLQGK